jgi:hypothetical protein
VAAVWLDRRRFSYRLQYEWLERDEGVSIANVAVGWLIRF